MAAGIYSGLTYGLKEARGAHDWVITPFFTFTILIRWFLTCYLNLNSTQTLDVL